MSMRDVLGTSAGQDVSEELGLFLAHMKRLLFRDVRPWQTDFFGGLKLPQSWNPKHIEQRLVANIDHYKSNYLVICCAIMTIQIIFTPTVLLSLILIASFGVYFLVIRRGPLIIAEKTIAEKHKRMIFVGISAAFLVLTGALANIIWAALYCLLVCLSHMLLRPRSVTSKTTNLQNSGSYSSTDKPYEEIKLSGIMDWFSGNGSLLTDPNFDASDPENPLSSSSNDQTGFGHHSGGYGTENMRKRGQQQAAGGPVNTIPIAPVHNSTYSGAAGTTLPPASPQQKAPLGIGLLGPLKADRIGKKD